MGGDDLGTLRPQLAATAPEAALVERARFGFHRAFPDRSAKRVFTWVQMLAGIIALAGLVWAVRRDAGAVWVVFHACAFALFAAAIIWRLIAAASLTPLLSRIAGAKQRWPVYTVLCPLYREAGVVFDLVAALSQLDYPREALDIKILVEADDAETLEAALAATYAGPIEVVVVPPAPPRTKPKALNLGLALARGDYVVVYDAEDRPHPLQLRAALAAFEDGDERLACVQAPLVVDNASAAWIARQFAAEYAIQFREILPLLARLRLPLPLGGSSNHFRSNVLKAVGGWDPYNVTEDADLGYRLAREGFRSGVIAPPTWEEAPITLKAWLDQRTRWIKGHMHTWLVLMRNPLRTAREMGWPAFAAMQLVLAGGVGASFAHGPLALILLVAAFSPLDLLAPADFVLALCGYAAAVFAALTASALSGDLSHARAAPTMPLYWPLASIAAYRAVFGLLLRPHHWAKTTHGLSPRAFFPFTRPGPRTREARIQRSDFTSAQNASMSDSG